MRKRVLAFLILTLAVSLVSYAYATLGSYVAGVDTAGTYTTEMLDSDRTEIYSIGGYLYALMTSSDVNYDHVRWKSSADNGLTWVTASDYINVDGTSTLYARSQYDGVYDPDRGIMYVAVGRSAATYTYRNTYLHRFLPYLGQMLLLDSTNVFYPQNTTHAFAWSALVSICLLDHKPVIAWYGQIRLPIDWVEGKAFGLHPIDEALVISYATTETPSDFWSYTTHILWANQTGYDGDYFSPEIMPVNSTSTLTAITDYTTEGVVLGYYSNSASMETLYTPLTSRTIEQNLDLNNNRQQMLSYASEYLENRTLNTATYAKNLTMAYGDASGFDLWLETFNTDNRSIGFSELVYNGSSVTYKPKYPSLTKDERNFFITYGVFNGTSAYDNQFVIERDENGDYSETTQFRIGIKYTTSAYLSLALSKVVIDNKLMLVYIDTVTGPGEHYAYFSGTYGSPEPIIEGPSYWDTLNVPFSLILGLTGLCMVFGGPVWAIHEVRERELKQVINGVIIFLVGVGLVIGWFFA